MSAHSPWEVHAQFEAAFNAHDIEGLLALYEPNATLIVGSRPVHGRESIGTSFQSLLASGPEIRLRTLAVIESGEGLALLHGEWEVQRSKFAESQLATQGVSAEVIRRQSDGTWLFIIDNPYMPTNPG